MARLVLPVVALALVVPAGWSKPSPLDAQIKQVKAAISKLKKEESVKLKAINEKDKALFRQKLTKPQKDQLNAMKKADLKAVRDVYGTKIKALQAQLRQLEALKRKGGAGKKGR
jgi:hypothetical protein